MASRGARGSESEELSARSPRASAKQQPVDSGDVDEEDSTTLDEEAKAPPRRASVGWGSEPAADDKSGDSTQAAAASGSGSAAAGEAKRGTAGRRRRGSETQSDAKSAKNRHFDDDGDANGACACGGDPRECSVGCMRADWSRLRGRWWGCCGTDIQEIPDLEEEEREPDITTQGASLVPLLLIVMVIPRERSLTHVSREQSRRHRATRRAQCRVSRSSRRTSSSLSRALL